MDKVVIKIKKLQEEAIIPTYAHVDENGENLGDVGMDFTAIRVEYDAKKDLYLYYTGLAFESDQNLGQFLFPRSSNRKTDAYLCNSVGIADSAIYRGEIIFCFKNRESYVTKAKMYALETAMFKSENFTEFKGNYAQAFRGFMDKQVERGLEFAPYDVGDKIGQMVMLQYPNVIFEETNELSETARGDGGFGSTDEKKN